jgi:glucose/arabinose dehydrogenase
MKQRFWRAVYNIWICQALALATASWCAAQVVADSALHVRELVGGLSQPTAMAFIGLDDILVLQKGDGRVRRVVNRTLQADDVLNLTVESASERGLLGIAVHPNFVNNKFVYLYFTHSGATCGPTPPNPPVNRVCRFVWDGDSLVNPSLIIDLPGTPGPNHNGGTMTFGPDGKLYIVIGDLNRNGQLQNFSTGPAPDDTGVILRLNDDGSTPIDNPFFAQGGNLAKYYAYGVRNSFGLAFDPVTQRLWDTENGPGDYDEINLVPPGFNSGWERIMGPIQRDPQGAIDLVQFPGSAYGDPKFSWLRPAGPTALRFMDSSRLGARYQNHLFVGDINNGRLYRFAVNTSRDGFIFAAPALSDLVADDDTELQETILGTGFGGISDIKVGPDGLLYVLSFGSGKIFVISGAAAATNFDGDAKSDISVFRNGTWFIRRSSDGGQTIVGWGIASDVPVLMDQDGDGKLDPTVFRDGSWFVLRSTGSSLVVSWGTAGDVPVAADYDGDGKTDIAVFRNGAWFILNSSGGSQVTGWGIAGDLPVPADYDGDGKTDIAVFRNGAWFIVNSTGGSRAIGWGTAGDTAVPADYDGDGIADLAVFRSGAWFILNSSGGNQLVGWGTTGDIPLN